MRSTECSAGAQERVPDQFQDFIRAVPENEIGRGNLQFFRELLLQVKRVAIGIKIHAGQGLLHRGNDKRRRTERIFVRRDLDDGVGGQAEFTRDFLDGPARLIHRQIFQKRTDGQRLRHFTGS